MFLFKVLLFLLHFVFDDSNTYQPGVHGYENSWKFDPSNVSTDVLDNIDSAVGVAPVDRPCASVFNASPTLLWTSQTQVPYTPQHRRRLLHSFIAFLLLTVETNPGPGTVTFGFLNAAGASRKGALIEDVISEHKLDALAVCETWIRHDAPDAVKQDLAPPSCYRVLHCHRQSNFGTRGGG